MSSGANKQWEWQLVSRLGHTSDEGLRQKAMCLKGHRGVRKPKVVKPKPKRKALPQFNLAKIFGGS